MTAASRPPPPAPFTGPERITAPAGNLCLLVAATAEAQARGLMGVLSVVPWDGMLFDFGAESTTPFFMKDTLISLDVAFVGKAGTVVDVQTMPPCPPELAQCPLYRSKTPYRYAIETEAGRAAKFGLTEGAPVARSGACN